jgi:hypothetical protein
LGSPSDLHSIRTQAKECPSTAESVRRYAPKRWSPRCETGLSYASSDLMKHEYFHRGECHSSSVETHFPSH